MELNINWLSEENLQKLFIEFPMPLALLRLEGGVLFVNKQFERHYHLNVLYTESIKRLLNTPYQAPLNTTLTNLDGVATHLLIYAIPLTHFTLLVFDNTPGGAPDEEIMEMRQRLAELEKLSVTDLLTGAWNRLPLKRTVEVEMKRSSRYHHPISLIFFDIDHFKNINDSHGHKAGDEVLKTVVNIVRERIRDSDTVYRWGGEEFVVLATFTDHGAAAILAENIRRLVEGHDFPVAGRVTISLGVAEYLPGDNFEMWLHRADKAMYAAKAKGRNQVVVDPFGGSDIWNRDRDSILVQLVWHSAFECGNSVIDEEHEQLFEQANQLINLALRDVDRDTLLSQFDFVFNAIALHFRDEEQILDALNYRELDEHKRLHAQLLQRADKLKKEVLSGAVPVGHLLEYVTYDVVAKHILIVDRKYYSLIEESALRER